MEPEPNTREARPEDGGARPAQPRRWTEGPWRWLGILIAVGALAVAGLWYRCGLRGCPDVETLRGYMPDEASVVLDRNGEEVSKLYLTRRTVVPIDSIPEMVQDAFIAMEDRRFREHGGVDWRRVFGALWRNVKSFEIEEGSSTITMQLARNVFPEQLPASQKTIWRKLGEARVAKSIEDVYSKDEILELYLNQIYFGHGAYGIEAAAQEYFGKSASELTLPEAALLAALPRAPSRLNPRTNEEAALEGRRLVLERMVEQGRLTAEEASEAAEAELTLRDRREESDELAPYFVEAVRRLLEDQLGDALYTGGYRIHSTLDLDAQRVLEEELARQLRAIEGGAYGAFRHETYASVHRDSARLTNGTPYLQAAGVLMDAHSGDMLALVGGRDFTDSEFNRATQARRQPGSAFKPFVYAAALSAGYPPTYQLEDQPIRLVLDNRRVWEPRNYDGSYAGVVTLREGLVRSKNVVTVRLAEEIGVHRAVGTAEQLGLGPDLPTNPSIVLGTAEVTPVQLMAAYAAFATLGSRPEPRFVTHVEDRYGNTVWARQPYSQRVLDPAAAFLTTNILEDAVNRGTGTAVRAVGFRGAAAGKTGTTQDASDVWFVGFTPDVVGTIWIGFDKRQTIVRGATGGTLAAPAWGRTMRRLGHGGSARWEPPPGVEARTVDEMGNVLAEDCPAFGPTRTEYFLSGTASPATCYPDYYHTYYDSLGLLPTDTPGDTVESWWQRMRNRVFGDEERAAAERRAAERAARLDSIGRSIRARDTLRLDSLPRPRPDTVRPDTIPPDTTRRPPPDTTRRPPPDTTRRPPPDTTR